MASTPEGVVRSVKVGGDDADKVSLVLIVVVAALDFELAFGVGIAFIGRVRRSLMKV